MYRVTAARCKEFWSVRRKRPANTLTYAASQRPRLLATISRWPGTSRSGRRVLLNHNQRLDRNGIPLAGDGKRGRQSTGPPRERRFWHNKV